MEKLNGTSHLGDTPSVYVNGDRCALMPDYRLALGQHFPEGTVLFDPSYIPPRRVPLGTSGDEVGVTRRKLLPHGHYEAYVEEKTTGELFPLARAGFCCIYLMNLPLHTTTDMLAHFFGSFADVQDVGVSRGRSTVCNGHGWVIFADPEKLQLVPRVLEFFPKHFIYTELSDRHPKRPVPFRSVVASADVGNAAGPGNGNSMNDRHSVAAGQPAPLPPPSQPRGTQWYPPAPASVAQQQQGQQRNGPFSSPHSPVTPDGLPKPINLNLPQPRSSKLAAAAATSGVTSPSGQGLALPLPRGRTAAAAAAAVPPPPPGAPPPAGTGTIPPAPRSAAAQTVQRPPNLAPIGGADLIPFEGDGAANRTPFSSSNGHAAVPVGNGTHRGIPSPLTGPPSGPYHGSSTVYLVTFIADVDASGAVRDGVFWPSPDIQQELHHAEESGLTSAVIFFLLQSHPAIFGYGRLALPYRHGMTRNGLCRIDWVRHHVGIREHSLRNINAHILLKLHDGCIVKPNIALHVCELADSMPSNTQSGGPASPVNEVSYGSSTPGGNQRGLSAGPPVRNGVYSSSAGTPVSPAVGGAGGGGGRSARTAPGAVGSSPVTQQPPRAQPVGEGSGPAIPIPASRRAQAAGAAATVVATSSPMNGKDVLEKAPASKSTAAVVHSPAPTPVL